MHAPLFHKKTPNGRVSGGIEKAFEDFSSSETWLFIAPHDDDIVMGAGILLQAAMESGIRLKNCITTDGRMGYCAEAQKKDICAIREKETRESFRAIGITDVEWLNFPDCDLASYIGRRYACSGDPCIISGCTGLQNAYTQYIRALRPERIFLPAGSDLHSDHKIVYQEVLISIFHAAGAIWPELGPPIPAIPRVYEMALYCDFPGPPNIKVEAPRNYLEKKLEAIAAYHSQAQIEILVQKIRASGPVEYFRDTPFNLYSPDNYKDLF